MQMTLVSSRKGHRKSRHGCICCKSRRVKCDEARPSCANCIRFGIPCHFPNAGGNDQTAANRGSQGIGLKLQPPPQLPGIRERGRGRPRRNWAALFHTVDSREVAIVSHVPHALQLQPQQDLSLNSTQAELLHQFILFTGPSLAGTDSRDDPIAHFWSHNAPRLGLATPSILYLSCSLSAYHLIHLGTGDERSHCRYRSLAQLYSARGLAELNKELPHINNQNCGALYVSAVLFCLNTFAAGPTSLSDLLICDSGGGTSGRWMSLATGVRLIRSTFAPSILFSGLTKPLDSGEPPEDSLPTCAVEGFRRIDWMSSLDKLCEFVTSNQTNTERTSTCLSALKGVRNIYEATYGNECGINTGSAIQKMVLIWLYFMNDEFVTLVRKADMKALLVLAYYAPLLNTISRAWFLDGWAKHLIEEYRRWLEWPMKVEESIRCVVT
ncbi:hypothetical protein BU24DRAFT_453089 [Aaosphaeria arxii CBS 175.79]|uniref:Zn(2)-C6 fungal-type domain-containing protein n=1 Tax=Aaosphaeria arxii CBS 175.79 TaxID=1450172 RepID=A0A6A5XHY6_9PLEO|nr:uncharacterized protein BU24DRAFT_453089 [Aaosphaeria arxii CBS 175.79]KAF2012732.1 hypothetical protein BU24DRAFT_453089 [Aaosphaeria arxii CBS 175.79]